MNIQVSKRQKPHRDDSDNPQHSVNPEQSSVSEIAASLHSTKIIRTGDDTKHTSTASAGTSRTHSRTTSMQGSSLFTTEQSYSRPLRPDFGTLGKVIKVSANMFPVSFDSKMKIFHYDLSLKEESETKKIPPAIKRIIFQAWVNDQLASGSANIKSLAKMCIYDGQKNLFCPKDLGIGTKEQQFKVILQEGKGSRPEEFTVRIKEVAQLDLNALQYYLSNEHRAGISVAEIDYPRDRISALEVLMRHVPAMNYLAFGRGGGSFFKSENGQGLRGGLEARSGWIQSLRPALGDLMPNYKPGGPIASYKQLLLNMDTATTSFYEAGPLPEVIMKFFGAQSLDDCRRFFGFPDKMEELSRHLRMVKIEIRYRSEGRRVFTIQGVSKKNPTEIVREFDGKRLNIADFFKQTYNLTLRYPWLPCIECGTKSDILLPMELCFVKPHQRHVGKLSDLQVADIIKVTAVPPHIRRQRIEEGMNNLHGKHDADFLKSWGVAVNNRMVKCDARILPPPAQSFSRGSRTSNDGTWRYGRDATFASAASLNSWGVVVFGAPNHYQMRDVERFFKGLTDTLKELGMNVKSDQRFDNICIYSERNERTDGTMKRALDRFGKVDLVFCVLGQPGSQTYNEIKKSSETNLGIMTQCIQGKHVRDDPGRKKPYFANIALKINVKMGGVNTFINPQSELPTVGGNRVPTMVLGADVTHPSPGEFGKASIAALVGSMDQRFCEYRTIIRAQSERVEIIQDIAGMVKELFLMFRARHNIFPKRIIFYRDGVSEGQFGEVVFSEVSNMKRMFRELCGENNVPTITFVVMSKRHHVRFFAEDRNDADNKGNMKAGTVIDRTVTHPFEFDFFLYSHAGLQGTSRPAHYHVLYDENKFTSDTLQAWTYRLCYLFCRSTRTVSMVPPAYYAHLVAARARCYVDGMGGGRGGPRGGKSTQKEIDDVLPEIQRTMFFV